MEPKTLIMPKFGIKVHTDQISSIEAELNPWIVTSKRNNCDIKIAGLTPIGTIAMVPTIDKRPIKVPYISRKVPVLESESTDSLLNLSMYLDLTPPEDYGYYHVSDKMQSLIQCTRSLHKQYTNEYKAVPEIYGIVDKDLFECALLIYENNQVWFQDAIDNCSIDDNTINKYLSALEQWFMCIIEPIDYEDYNSWMIREQTKILKGYSSYCDPELYHRIFQPSEQVISYITELHTRLHHTSQVKLNNLQQMNNQLQQVTFENIPSNNSIIVPTPDELKRHVDTILSLHQLHLFLLILQE